MSAPLELEEAQARLLELLSPTPASPCPVDESAGRLLAEPVIARRTQPPTDLSAMDGYATSGDSPWLLKGESRAGAPFDMVLGKGDAI
ncbi:MAG: molybdopterin molybdenumtransferase MoeA, partial [Pseudomonadota bacterium]|nr:molybdopterin molybdenumtransferase MoeA [Pseudomonadota bacterium]